MPPLRLFVAVAFLLTPAAASRAVRTHCSNACASAWDGVCDGTTTRCPLGSDCADCGAVPIAAADEPPPITHLIQHGDTLGKIGEKHGLMGLTLQFWNKIPDPTKLLKAQTIDVTYAQHQARVAEWRRELGVTYQKEVRAARARALRTLFGGPGKVQWLLREIEQRRQHQHQHQHQHQWPRADETDCMRSSVQDLLHKLPLQQESGKTAAAVRAAYRYDMSSPTDHIWWAPKKCRPSDTVAIVVPFRNRHAQLPTFLARMHLILRAQNLRYRIFVIEQVDTGPFNRGALLNIGSAEAMRLAPHDSLLGAMEDLVGGMAGGEGEGDDDDTKVGTSKSSSKTRQRRLCFVFHDVDMLPVSAATPYTCPTGPDPHHLSTTVDTFVYQCPYSEIMGGVTTFTTEQLVATNGYANNYIEWGGEDDDMSFRVRYAAGRRILRPADCLARKGACIYDPACQDQVGIISGYEGYDYAATEKKKRRRRTRTRTTTTNDNNSEDDGDDDTQHPGSFVMNGGKTNADKHSSTAAYRAIFDSPTEFIRSGLSNVRYERLSVENHPLYTMVRVRLPGHNN